MMDFCVCISYIQYQYTLHITSYHIVSYHIISYQYPYNHMHIISYYIILWSCDSYHSIQQNIIIHILPAWSHKRSPNAKVSQNYTVVYYYIIYYIILYRIAHTHFIQITVCNIVWWNYVVQFIHLLYVHNAHVCVCVYVCVL